MRFALVLLLVPLVATAAPKFTTSVAVKIEGDGAPFTLDASKLDACWRKPTRAKAKVTVDGGKITKVEVVENTDKRSAPCISKTLVGATVDLEAGLAVIELVGKKGESSLTSKDRKLLDVMIKSSPTGLAKFGGPPAGSGIVGPSAKGGAGGGGQASGDFVSQGAIDAGGSGSAPRDAKVAIGQPEGTTSLTADEINRVIKSRAGVFRACYQKELHREPKLAGKIVVQFTIEADGTIGKRPTIAAGSTLKNAGVEDCMVANVMRLRFPASTGTSKVTYPFIFTQQQ
jgi:hypothetical protein